MTRNFVNSTFSTLWQNEKQFEDAERKFSTLQPEDHVSFFYQMLRKKKLLPVIDMKCSKSNVEAANLKKLGDKAFCRNDNILAVKFYTKSAAMALPNSPELASAYTNRSASLFRLESYTSCLRDIRRALENNCDQKLKEQLEKRRLACLLRIALQRVMPRFSANSDHVSQTGEKVDVEQKETPTVPSESGEKVDTEQKETPTVPSESDTPPATSNVKLAISPEYGRHILATSEIKPGDILCIENPYASVLSLDLAYSHCANCYLRCDSLIACPTCTSVMFCTAPCLESAYKRFHRLECKIIGHIQHFGIKDSAWLAIRMLMVATNQGKTLETMMKHSIFGNPMIKETNVLPRMDLETYAHIHNLEDHVEERRFDYPNGLMAALLLHILKHSSFFGSTKNNTDSDSAKKETFVGTLLLKFILTVECNAFQIFETVNPSMGTETPSTFHKKQIGWSIYSFHSYYNHSCDENATLHFYYDKVITRAIQLIYPGQQIFINYYRSFTNCRREIREKYLYEQYYFRCTCRACEEDWPQLEDTALVSPKLKDNSISMETLKHYLSRSKLLRQKNPQLFNERLTVALCEYTTIIQKSVKMPFKEYCECQEKLRQIFATNANFYAKGIVADSLFYLA